MRLPVYTCAFTVTAIVKYVIYMLTWRVGERCSWEFVTSLDFDWSFMTGKRKFAWPMVGSKICVMMDSHLMNAVIDILFLRQILFVLCYDRNVS